VSVFSEHSVYANSVSFKVCFYNTSEMYQWIFVQLEQSTQWLHQVLTVLVLEKLNTNSWLHTSSRRSCSRTSFISASQSITSSIALSLLFIDELLLDFVSSFTVFSPPRLPPTLQWWYCQQNCYYYTVSQKNIFDRNLKSNYQILIIFGTNIPDTTCHQMTIQFPTSPNVCFCTT